MNKHGGKAFPSFNDSVENNGMSLRDYFAAKAMQGLLANDSFAQQGFSKVGPWAYNMADIMLEERNK